MVAGRFSESEKSHQVVTSNQKKGSLVGQLAIFVVGYICGLKAER